MAEVYAVNPRCGCARCIANRLLGPVVLVTIGVLFLLDNLTRIDFGQTWPVILLVIGGVKLLQYTASIEGHQQPPGLAVAQPGGAAVVAQSPAQSSAHSSDRQVENG